MSLFPVANFVPVTYKGALFIRPVSLLSRGAVLTNQNQQAAPPHQSNIVNVDIDWIKVYTGQAVSLILQNSQVGGPLLDHILMVYCDNTLNPCNTTLIWADTQQSIEIPAFSAGYYPCFTSQYTCTVYNGTTGNSIASEFSMAATTIQFCNFGVPPGNIQEGYSTSGLQNNQLAYTNFDQPLATYVAVGDTRLLSPIPGFFYELRSFDMSMSPWGGGNAAGGNYFLSLHDSTIPPPSVGFWQTTIGATPTANIPPVQFLQLCSHDALQMVTVVGAGVNLYVSILSGVATSFNTFLNINLAYRAVAA